MYMVGSVILQDSCSYLQGRSTLYAGMVEMVDTQDLGSCDSIVGVRVPLPAPYGSVPQRLEGWAHNPRYLGSNPSRSTSPYGRNILSPPETLIGTGWER